MTSSRTTPHTSRPVWPLALCTALLATGGLLLLTPSPPPAVSGPSIAAGHAPAPMRTHTPARTAPPRSRGPALPPVALGSPTISASRTTTPAPPRGDGPAGDPAIQHLVASAWPRDLPASDEQQLLALGRRLLAADAAGVGRAEFPALYPDGEQAVAVPAFTRLRIQAALARADPAHPGRAVVHLVWGGADRGGTYTDGRQSDFTFLRTPSKNGAPPWMPLSLS